MKIDLQSIDREQFMVHEHIVDGQVVYLVQPQYIGVNWSRENKIFRSSVWDSEGNPVSLSFPKFTNWGEKPEVFPVPTDLKGATIMEKLDGSLLIVSKWNGNFILRTRGTVDASKLDNGAELEIFKQTILSKLDDGEDTWPYSILFEWTSPTQKIILNYGDAPEWHLVGMIEHSDYSLIVQELLDIMAKKYGLKRPATYTFTSVSDLLDNVEQWKGKEGVVVYSNGDQSLHKVKGAWYLALHHMKSELASLDKVIDTWFTLGRPNYQTFYQKIADQFDFELANQIQGDMSRICDAYKEVEKIISGMTLFVEGLKNAYVYPTRKERAAKIINSYGQTNRASFCFKLLDGKVLGDEDLKKLLYQVLKK